MPDQSGWALKAADETIGRLVAADGRIAATLAHGGPDRSRKVLARIMVRHWIAANAPPYSEALDFDRASGACVCPKCGLEYRDHPHEPTVLSNTGEPFLRTLCDGRRVKL